MAKSTSWILILRNPDGRTWQVGEDDTFSLGRHLDNDLILADNHTSRFHARISWIDGRPCLADLASVNGTYVGGRRVRGSAVLRDGDRLLVGDTSLDVELIEDHGAALLASDDDSVAVFTELDQPEIRGSFDRAGILQRLLRQLEECGRTGTLELTLGVRRASVTFSNGQVAFARHQRLCGLEALERVLHSSAGSFCFRGSIELRDDEPYLGASIRELLKLGFFAVSRRTRRLSARVAA